jgi:hypothetical protein
VPYIFLIKYKGLINMNQTRNMDGNPLVQRHDHPPREDKNSEAVEDDILASDQWVSTPSDDADSFINGDAPSDSENDAGNNDRNSKKTIAQHGVSKMIQGSMSASMDASHDTSKYAQSNADNDADNADRNSKNSIPMQNFLHTLHQIPLPITTPVEQNGVAPGAYDCLQLGRLIRGNWKIVAPALTAASGVAAVALLTIGARGSVAGTQLSLGARWATWIAGYLSTQATIIIGTTCIPSLQCR